MPELTPVAGQAQMDFIENILFAYGDLKKIAKPNERVVMKVALVTGGTATVHSIQGTKGSNNYLRCRSKDGAEHRIVADFQNLTLQLDLEDSDDGDDGENKEEPYDIMESLDRIIQSRKGLY